MRNVCAGMTIPVMFGFALIASTREELPVIIAAIKLFILVANAAVELEAEFEAAIAAAIWVLRFVTWLLDVAKALVFAVTEAWRAVSWLLMLASAPEKSV